MRVVKTWRIIAPEIEDDIFVNFQNIIKQKLQEEVDKIPHCFGYPPTQETSWPPKPKKAYWDYSRNMS